MEAPEQMYLGLMKKILTNVIYEDPPIPSTWAPSAEYERVARCTGLDWPSRAHTMVGLRRLDNLQDCLESVLREKVPGDLIETGVWRGGACIFMRAILRAYGVTDRLVWAADSFAGMPRVGADARQDDRELAAHEFNDVMAVSVETVKRNFEIYGLLDDQVRFLRGWFRDTLPAAPVERLAIIRLDGDLYESTMDALTCLYPRLSAGGYVIIDDFIVAPCREAVHEFRDRMTITDPLQEIDGVGVFWRRKG
jgi:cephalosporin hydroxylase